MTQEELRESTRKFTDWCISKGFAVPLVDPTFIAESIQLKVEGKISHKDLLFIINIERVRLYFEKVPEVKELLMNVFDSLSE